MTATIDHNEAFRARFAGQILTRGDSDYDSARSLWNGSLDHHPAMIARCQNAADVAAAIEYARAEELEISVRGGAHSFSGASVAEDGLMIDLSPMRAVSVDPGTRRAVCGGGATMADLDAATQAYGLAVTGGTISHTGVGGLTLGGGMGWLLHRHGLTIDNLISAEVVLADGQSVRASADEHPDLFWALRGGGGNFGVVTAFEFQVHPVGPEVHVGLLFWKLEHAAEALRVGRDAVAGLTRDAGALMAAGLAAPPAPFVPPEHHFTPGCALLIAGFSGAEEHERILRPVREALPPLFEFVSPLPYVQVQQLLDDAAPWGILDYSKALQLYELTDDAIAVVARHLPRKRSPMTFSPIFPLGGAYRDVGDGDTAFGGSRSAKFVLSIDAVTDQPDVLEVDRQWVRSLWDALRPYASDSGSYVNFMAEYEEDRVRASYGADKYERLARVKAAYDPENVFHLNANIIPSQEGLTAAVPD